MNILIHDAAQVVCVAARGERVKRGREMSELHVIEGGSLLIEQDRITWVGVGTPPHEPDRSLDARGKVVMPGFIDSHTHLVYAGSRADEFEQRLQGVSYQEIAARGGGIHATVRHVRQAAKPALKELTRQRLDQMLHLGITTVEIKSGYGLNEADEIKCLEVISELRNEQACELVATFMGGHEIPQEYRGNRAAYINLLTERLIPAVAQRGLAEFCDVFCEEGVFDLQESEAILQAGAARGLRPKVHADEFTPLGGAELAARLSAVSADHLLKISEAGIKALQHSNTVATLLPGTAFFLGLPYAPARRLIDAALPVAIASDCNPGSCPTFNLPLIGTMACTQMKMTPAEVVTALTLNAAAALDRSDRLGSIEVGKRADVAVHDVSDYRTLFYEYGVNHVSHVIKSGRVVVGA